MKAAKMAGMLVDEWAGMKATWAHCLVGMRGYLVDCLVARRVPMSVDQMVGWLVVLMVSKMVGMLAYEWAGKKVVTLVPLLALGTD